jgi:HlyD family secretion protein
MKLSKMRWLLGALVVVIATVGFITLRNGSVHEAKGDAPAYKEMVVEHGDFDITVTASGVVKPIDRVEIKSKASGRIEELAIEVGDFVKKGSLISRLDQKDERAELEQAKANLAIAEAELKQSQHTYDRRDQLFEKGLVSEEELGVIELSLATAKAKLLQAQTALERAQESFAESIVRAPIDGIILQKYVEEGQIIASGVNNVGGGTPIADIADMRSVHIEAGIDEIDIGKIRPGQEAIVIAEAYPNRRFKGEIVRLAPEARVEQNVTLFDVIIEVENTDGFLKSGMNANVEISIVSKENVLLVSTIALQPPQGRGKPNVRTVLLKQGNQFVPQEVEIGLSSFKDAEVIAGLQAGDVVGVPITSRLKTESDRFEQRIRERTSFGITGGQSQQSRSGQSQSPPSQNQPSPSQQPQGQRPQQQ